MKKFFDDVKVSGNLCVVGEISSPNDIFVSDIRVATEFDVNSLRNELDSKISSEVELLNSTISTKEEELKTSIQEGDSKLQENIDALRKETLEGDGSLLSQLNEFKGETAVNIQSITDSISLHASFCDEKFAELYQKDSLLETSIESNSQSISDLNKDLKAHKDDKSNPHEVTLSQLISNGAYAEIKAGEEGDFNTVEIRARDLNRSGNDYVVRISPEEASISSGEAKLLFSDASISFSVPVSGVDAVNGEDFVTKKQLDSSCEELETLIKDKISEQTHFDFDVVSKLPEEGIKGVIYLVLRGGDEENNVHEEYIWNDKEKLFEKIGDTKIDLTPYALNSSLEVEVARAIAAESEESSRAKTAEAMLASEISNVESEYKKADTALESKIEAAYKLADEVISGRLQVVEKHMTDYEAKVGVTESKISSLESSVASSSSEISNNSSKIIGLESSFASINSEITSLKTEDAALSGKIDVNGEKIIALESSVSEQSTEIGILKSSSASISESIALINSEYKTADAAIIAQVEAISVNAEENKVKYEELVKEVSSAKESIYSVSTKSEQLGVDVESLKSANETITETISSNTERVAVLEEKVKTLESVDTDLISRVSTVEGVVASCPTNKDVDDKILASTTSILQTVSENYVSNSLLDQTVNNSVNSVISGIDFVSEEKLLEEKQQVLSEISSSYVTKDAFSEESSKVLESTTLMLARIDIIESDLPSRATIESLSIVQQASEANTSEIDGIKSRVETLESKEDLKPLIEANTVAINAHTTSINAHTTSINANTTSISGLVTRVEALEAKHADDEEGGEDIPAPDIPTVKENEKFLFTATEGNEESLTFTCNYTVQHSSGMVMVQVFKVVSEGLFKTIVCDITVNTVASQVTVTLNDVTGTEQFAILVV